MSKELEAFDKVVDFISEMPLSYKGYNNLGASEYISDRLNEIEDALNDYVELRKALTPPTQEEVCEALSEELGEEIIYIGFNFINIDRTKIPVQLNLNSNKIEIWAELPPNLITLIGRFYESKMK